MQKIILGSASPRRKRLLEEAGYKIEIAATDADEISDPANPVGTVVHNAIEKNLAARKCATNEIIITADTLVWFNGKLIGKPKNKEEATEYLRSFSGAEQTVFTAVVVSNAKERSVRTEATLVRFKKLTDETIENYITLVCPYDRAGGYDISEHGEMIIEEIIGSYTNVVGLPIEMTKEMIEEMKNEH